ncbi:MAG: hypothetical protein WCA07_08945 [Gloeobacterales cyanobacterium]
MLNPWHVDFAKIQISPPESFVPNARLLKQARSLSSVLILRLSPWDESNAKGVFPLDPGITLLDLEFSPLGTVHAAYSYPGST